MRENKTPDLQSVQDHCRKRIARYKVPRALYVVDKIERSPSGKPDYPWATRVARTMAGL
jgi:acyl-CoA synthetase (AMP-forming)/AMP-acid ligase II